MSRADRDKSRALKLLPVVPIGYERRQVPSLVRCFCAWLRDAGRWLNYGWGPAYEITRDERPAPPWMFAVLFGLLAIGALVVRLCLLFPRVF